MHVTISSVIRIDEPTPQIRAWCKEFLTVTNPEYTRRLRMGLWTGRTPASLSLYETRGNSLILPYGTLRDILPMLKDSPVISEFTNDTVIDFPQNVSLYDYQQIAVDACVAKVFGILQSPAGSGKTQMGIALIERLKKPTLWLTHTKDLLQQSYDRAKQYIPESMLGIITAGKINMGEGITFATVQTMCRLDLNQYRDCWDVIIVDECHRIHGAPTSITQFYKVLNTLKARHKYGLSATVHRSDGMIAATYALIGKEAYVVPAQAVADRTMQIAIRPIATDTPPSLSYLGTDGMIQYSKLINYLCSDPERNKLISTWITAMHGHSCLILSDRLEQLETLMCMLPLEFQQDAVMVSGRMVTKKERTEREQALEDMRQGKKKYLFATYSLCKEGLDIPRLDRLFLATPQKDYAVITQSIGRVARTFEGKQEPIVYDFVDTNISIMNKFYKERCRTYKKCDCRFIGE